MADHNLLGKKGEEIALEYLRKKGFKILKQNWREGKDEVDIIANDGEYLVFVEVKTRRTNAFGEPEFAITKKKQGFLIRAANSYIFKYDYWGESRFDVVSIIVKPNETEVYHIKDAFYPSMI